ncbi:ABC transporter, ATP-binding protein [uncultured Desulfobacterium sp.]|uniref:ABC transporter, ATP-binding protein n=1 Tax=uncultured Desulfobacterium sp. TaxID=201089 RepID=A0A445N3X2_9BACT|nr:ABC transporter, ATP-binding protein [uncultured Desulfobacterium sp.]
MIRVQEIYKSFGKAQVLKGVSFEVPQGDILALIGRSGYGKSVILKHVAGLLKPDKGHVFINGSDLCNLRGRNLLKLIERFGFLFQNGALFDSMTIFDNVAFPLREKTRMTERQIRERVLTELEQVGLIGSEGKFPSQISGGMIKRASLARALIEEPDIMLFDEPTTGLDPITGKSILALIDSCHRRIGFTGIIVTHEIPRVFSVVDQVALLHEGVVLFHGSPSEIMTSDDPIIRPFVQAATDGAVK